MGNGKRYTSFKTSVRKMADQRKLYTNFHPNSKRWYMSVTSVSRRLLWQARHSNRRDTRVSAGIIDAYTGWPKK